MLLKKSSVDLKIIISSYKLLSNFVKNLRQLVKRFRTFLKNLKKMGLVTGGKIVLRNFEKKIGKYGKNF